MIWGSSAYSFLTPCAFLALASTCFKNVKIPCLFSKLQLLVLQILFTFLFDNHFPFLIFVHIFITRLLENAWIYCGSILYLVQIFISFVSNSLSYITTPKKTKKKQKKNWTKDKIEPQQIFQWKIASWPLFWVEGQRLNMCQQGRDLYPPTYLPLSGL